MKRQPKQTRFGHWFLQCLILAVTSPALTAGPTYVGGIISGQTWRLQDSPFLVTNNITVASLTIEPCVEVVFLGNYVFEVPGVLRAVGTSDCEIRFRPTNTISGWQGMLFQNSVPGSQLEWCRIEGSLNSAVRITDSQPSFSFCTIANNSSTSGGGGFSVNMSSADLIISCCTISNNLASRANGGGINAVMGSGTLILSNCFVVNNDSTISDGNVQGGGVRLQGGGYLVKCVISGNRCEGNEGIPGGSSSGRGGGIYAANGTNRFLACTIRDNLARGTAPGGMQGNQGFASGGGMHLVNGAAEVLNSILAANVTSSTHGSAGGGMYADNIILRVENSTVMDNNILGIQSANGGSATVENSILYFNNANAAQVSAGTVITYSDVQEGYAGVGNINFNPIVDPVYRIVSGSPCIDVGNPDSSFNDVCFGPKTSHPGPRNDMGAHGGPDACAWNVECPCDLPEIISHPSSVVACKGETVTFRVNASGVGSLTYQWYFNTNTAVAGATNQTLVISEVDTNNVGTYHVVVSGRCGSVSSTLGTLLVTRVCVSIALHPGLSMSNLMVGQSYSIQYATNMNATPMWTTATNFTAQASDAFWCDREPAALPRRFYRVIESP